MADNITDDIALHIAKRLTAARLQKTWTREMLAQQSGVNVHTLKRFERTGQISLPRLIALCEALGMLDELTRGFKPRQRVSVEGWKVSENQLRQRGRHTNFPHYSPESTEKEHLV
jgi:transcriptional regulator with XRE-family HTH domain